MEEEIGLAVLNLLNVTFIIMFTIFVYIVLLILGSIILFVGIIIIYNVSERLIKKFERNKTLSLKKS